MAFTCSNLEALNDASRLLLHCAKKVSSVSQQDRERMEDLLFNFLPEFLFFKPSRVVPVVHGWQPATFIASLNGHRFVRAGRLVDGCDH